MAGRVRADDLMVRRSLATSRSQARALIMSGAVRSGDRVVDKAGMPLDEDAVLELLHGRRFASRGGEKLNWALERFRLDVADLVCADFGASTGGFTDVLLHRGARRVYAIDVGYGQLDYRIRQDERVVVMERTNVRYLDGLSEPIDLVTIDVSFISLGLVLPAALRVLSTAGRCVALIKPQFEAGRERVGRGGVVRDPDVHADVMRRVLDQATDLGFSPTDLTKSPITGPAGNVEFLVLLERSGSAGAPPEALIRAALAEPLAEEVG